MPESELETCKNTAGKVLFASRNDGDYRMRMLATCVRDIAAYLLERDKDRLEPVAESDAARRIAEELVSEFYGIQTITSYHIGKLRDKIAVALTKNIDLGRCEERERRQREVTKDAECRVNPHDANSS
jgi:hypothetical protein